MSGSISCRSCGRAGAAPQIGRGQAGVALAARNDMDVKLRHDVAERGDVELSARRHGLEGARQPRDLGHQLGLLAPRRDR